MPPIDQRMTFGVLQVFENFYGTQTINDVRPGLSLAGRIDMLSRLCLPVGWKPKRSVFKRNNKSLFELFYFRCNAIDAFVEVTQKERIVFENNRVGFFGRDELFYRRVCDSEYKTAILWGQCQRSLL